MRTMPLTYALFETAADLCATVNTLHKQGIERSQLSLMARDLESDAGEQDARRTTIAQVLQALDLASIALCLEPMVLATIPEAGTFLTAGWPARKLSDSKASNERAQLDTFLMENRHSAEEAAFLQGRLQAGALMLGLYASEEQTLLDAREVFADQQAVYVGLIDFEIHDCDWADGAISTPDAPAYGDVILVDATAGSLNEEQRSESTHLIGAGLRDEAGNEIGTICATILDLARDRQELQDYVVIERAGFLGVGQNLHVLPAGIIQELPDGSGYQASCSLESVENGPAFDARLPFSRREEQAICAYYGTKPHWES